MCMVECVCVCVRVTVVVCALCESEHRRRKPIELVSAETMGTAQSKDKMHCTRYVDGKGPLSVEQQVEKDLEGRYGTQLVGHQPEGEMTLQHERKSLPGYPKDDTIKINFAFADGIQTEKHPRPGEKYHGLKTVTFLPQNIKGAAVVGLLEKAFQQKLLFTVATDSSGEEAVVPTDIPLKTSCDESGPESLRYPDPDYLTKVVKLLKDKGIK
ncbi:E3 ubiquitin-protein ligase DTX3L1 isoform X2 [Alosa pseudoharengus]|uniref:E3 ubiquitin-protein ligase DTX3L1 isoform X2 n=1 Tax=Alosa pseudoharengus TaxID=34774 RepID=UPI003F8BE3AC